MAAKYPGRCGAGSVAVAPTSGNQVVQAGDDRADGLVGRGRRRLGVGALQLEPDLFPMHAERAGGADADAHRVAAYLDDRDDDVVADDDVLADPARQDQHRAPPSAKRSTPYRLDIPHGIAWKAWRFREGPV